MCYLKQYKTILINTPANSVVLHQTNSCLSSDDLSSITSTFSQEFNNIKQINATDYKSQSEKLFNLLLKLKYNSVLLGTLQNKININSQSLDKLQCQDQSQQIQISNKKFKDIQIPQGNESTESIGEFSKQTLTQKLFTKKCYKFKLNLVGKISQIIYKQRNLSFSVSLTNMKGQNIRNSNIIDLCFGVCDLNGTWISQSKNGENFMKGKTETELFHGEGNFCKIYPREVSRQYENGKINFIVYPKTSILYYSGINSSLQSKINCDEIEPLVIEGLTIRAKKKQQMFKS